LSAVIRAAGLFAWLLSACASPTELVLVVHGELEPEGLTHVEVTVSGPSTGPVETTVALASTPPPLTLGISPYDPGALPAYVEIRVVGLRDGTEVVRREMRTRFAAGRSVLVQVVLTTECSVLVCDDGETCDEGGCTEVDVDPETLVDFGGSTERRCARRGAVPERCNGVDDDCDALVDEAIDLSSDPENCGECGRRCPLGCDAGVCTGSSTDLAAGAWHACAWRTGGAPYCWGSDSAGQLGDGTIVRYTGSDAGWIQRYGAPVASLAGVDALALGALHSCAIDTGRLSCFGGNFDGQVGDGTTTDTEVPVSVPSLSEAQNISLGVGHSCAIDDGAVFCWGRGDRGQLGVEPREVSSVTARRVEGLPEPATAIAAGAEHSCAIAAGAVYCWGANESGQLGNGTTVDSDVPVEISGLTGATVIAAGDAHTCAVLASGTVTCWGANSHRQLGDGTAMDRSRPVPVLAVSGVDRVSASLARHTCAWGAGGAFCWGNNTAGQLGMNPETAIVSPVAIALEGILSMAAGGVADRGFTCAVVSAGGVFCWGNNESGQLGDRTTESSFVPRRVADVP
jgi:alpha-tubulin suppressor-like RCC1 family protein